MANLMNEAQLERYAARLEEDQANRECNEAWEEIISPPRQNLHAEYRYTSLVSYLQACINVTAGV